LIRLLTAHFHVSYDCLETLQIWQDAEKVAEYIDAIDDDIPLILTGDLNIRNESMAIKTLREKITQESESFTNTLCHSIHPYFQRVPEGGLGIDHIFTKNISVFDCQVREVVVSDHLPLVLDFSL
jgi:endonuclease/exonuclease/phosphatase (EEP) superfamily protein YafD